MVGFYLEQVRRHPGAFSRVTLESLVGLMRAQESLRGQAFPAHSRLIAGSPWESPPRMPEPDEPAPVVDALDQVRLSSSLAWLLLAAASPLLAWGAARRASFLALGGFVYFCLLAALVEAPIARYRLPGVPLVYPAGCLALGGIARYAQLATQRRSGLRPGAPANPASEGGAAPFGEAARELEAEPEPEPGAAASDADRTRASALGDPIGSARVALRKRAPGPESLRRLAIALAALPAWLGAAVGEAGRVGFLLVLAAQVALALIVAHLRAGVRPRYSLLDTGAWFAACCGAVAVTLLSSPAPAWVGAPTPGRRAALLLLGLGLALAVSVFLFAPRKSPETPDR